MNGLCMLIDLEKAFDSFSKSYITLSLLINSLNGFLILKNWQCYKLFFNQIFAQSKEVATYCFFL